MKKIITHTTNRLFSPIKAFMNNSQATGVILIGCTIFSMTMANLSGTHHIYASLWHAELFDQPASAIHLPQSPLHIINDFMMGFFFLLVGMEIKREIIEGELASVRKSLLPFFAAVGGMVCPAIIFSLFNSHSIFLHGWGIPMATDIAFSLGVLSLLGNKVPFQLKIFLMALAVIDDLGGILTIAVFYANQIHLPYLVPLALLLPLLVTMNKLGVKKIKFYILPGLLLWYCIYNSGIHGTIAGVLFAFCIPKNPEFEMQLSKPVNFIIMPLFAMANMSIILNISTGSSLATTLSLGIIAGLVLGKPLGIFLFSFIAHKTGIASLPSNTNYKQLFGVGILGGIGFTMSIFTATLAYHFTAFQTTAKVAVIIGSAISATIGLFYLTRISAVSFKKMDDKYRDKKTIPPNRETSSILSLSKIS